jgi:hypothetical protein
MFSFRLLSDRCSPCSLLFDSLALSHELLIVRFVVYLLFCRYDHEIRIFDSTWQGWLWITIVMSIFKKWYWPNRQTRDRSGLHPSRSQFWVELRSISSRPCE